MDGFGNAVGCIVVVVAIIAAFMFGYPNYKVWSMEMKGKASFAEAQQNRSIRVLEAQAALDAAKLTAQAEIERAKGANEANSIMTESLGGAENYLRWSYINMLQETAGKAGQTTIYIPTEAAMPILEAGRR